jgi:hypothetical protein
MGANDSSTLYAFARRMIDGFGFDPKRRDEKFPQDLLFVDLALAGTFGMGGRECISLPLERA